MSHLHPALPLQPPACMPLSAVIVRYGHWPLRPAQAPLDQCTGMASVKQSRHCSVAAQRPTPAGPAPLHRNARSR